MVTVHGAAASAAGYQYQACKRFLALGSLGRESFLSRVFVVDGAPHLEDVDAEARRCLAWALPKGHEDRFMHLLWGWWDEQAIGILRDRRPLRTRAETRARHRMDTTQNRPVN